jgi:hypothetical protein
MLLSGLPSCARPKRNVNSAAELQCVQDVRAMLPNPGAHEFESAPSVSHGPVEAVTSAVPSQPLAPTATPRAAAYRLDLVVAMHSTPVLAMLRADGWDSPRVATLEQLLADAAKQPGNRDTLRHLLDALADFAGPVECWWKEE